MFIYHSEQGENQWLIKNNHLAYFLMNYVQQHLSLTVICAVRKPKNVSLVCQQWLKEEIKKNNFILEEERECVQQEEKKLGAKKQTFNPKINRWRK